MELVDEVDSTNRVLLERARAGAGAGAVLVARHQTAGRGRLGRVWEAPPGASLLVSVLVRPALSPGDAHLLTIAAALAAVEACADVAGVRPSTKWPNDVVVETAEGTAKLAGLLAESLVDGGTLTAVVLGMGLNVNWEEAPPAGGTALNLLTGGPVDGGAVLAAWLRELGRRLEEIEAASGRRALLEAYRASCSTLGREVAVDTASGRHVGTAAGITDEGHLEVLVDGRTAAFAVGDVTHVRARVSGSTGTETAP